MGIGDEGEELITNAPCPMPHAPCPMPHQDKIGKSPNRDGF